MLSKSLLALVGFSHRVYITHNATYINRCTCIEWVLLVGSRENQSDSLMLSTLGKIFSRRHFEIFFLFLQENCLDISCKLSPLGKIRKISWTCRLLNLPIAEWLNCSCIPISITKIKFLNALCFLTAVFLGKVWVVLWYTPLLKLWEG